MIFNNEEIYRDEFHCGKLYYESIFINFKNFAIIITKKLIFTVMNFTVIDFIIRQFS